MKRAALGGAHRGPVAPSRQRRTIRFVQAVLLLFAVALFIFAGYSFGRARGYDEGRRAETIEAPAEPGLVQAAVLIVLGGIALGGAWVLGAGGPVRVPTPARLEQLAGRAEAVAVERAEAAAAEPQSRESTGRAST